MGRLLSVWLAMGHDPAADARMQNGPAGRQRISRAAGGRGHDEAISTHVRHEVVADVDAQLNHAGRGAARHHHVVQRKAFVDAFAVAPDVAFQHHAVFLFEVAGHDGPQRFLVAVERNVGDETQPTLVDSHQRQLVARQFAGNAQHGAVAAHHHGQVAALAHLFRREAFVVGDADVAGGVGFERNLKAAADQELRDVFQRGPNAQRLILAHDRCMTEPGWHANHYTIGPTWVRPAPHYIRDGPGRAPTYNAAMLDERAKTLLKTLVERYIADGTPVGSRTLSRTSGLDLSPATIRNVMSDLEELGLIASPHTSAGRIPTARGYRLFVDTMLTARSVDMAQMPADVAAAREQLHPDQPQRVIAQAASLLSSLSSFVGVVTAPRKASVFHHIEFLRLGDKRVLVILVAPDGDVQNRVIFTARDYQQSELVEATNFLNANYAGLTIEEVRERLKNEIDALRSEIGLLMQAAVQAGSDVLAESTDNVIVSGERNLLTVQDFGNDMSSLRRLFDVFEQKTELMRLLEVSSRAEGVRIYIGGESRVVPFEELSVVTAPYEVDGRIVGTLGVIGPTRMAYDRMIQIVDITSRLVGSALSAR